MNRIHIKQYSWTRILQLSLVISCLDILAINSRLLAQIIPDATLGAEKSRVTSNQEIHGINSTLIEGGAIRDSNLFHSFQEFNIDRGRGAYFSNPAAVQNIFSRVTGGNISEIFGTLGVLGNANLFFLNPNGILFGPNASLDLKGSFMGTNSDRFFFENGWEFSASQPEAPPLLTINMPIGLGFLDNQSAKIENAGNLTVGFGQGITLAGNQVSITGSLNAAGGRVELLGTESVALLENATIDVSSSTGGGTVLIGGDFQGLGTLPNAQRTYVGENVTIKADALTNGNGGEVIVWADEVTGFYGNISAKGGLESGHGGLVEVSGKEHLIFRGDVNTNSVNGSPGTLLLDPTNIIIADGGGDEARDGSDRFSGNNSEVEGSILTAPLSQIEDTAPTTIYESELESLSGDTNIILQATNNIILEDLSDDGLELAAGAGVVALSADADADGVGDFVMEDNISDTIFTNGRDIAISGANLIIGNIDTSVLTLGDAGDLIETALSISDSPAGSLKTISGNISNVEDVDLFQIYLTGEETFSATTVNSETTLDTQLFLFDANGLGVYANDTQAECNCLQATLPAGATLTPKEPGVYYLGITTFGNNAVSSEGAIFPSSFEVSSETIKTPTSDGGFLPLSGWIGGLNQGSYKINLTGAEAVEANVVESIQQRGNSGSITLDATEAININGLINTSGNLDDGGIVEIKAKSVFLTNAAQINSLTTGEGNGGDVTIDTASLSLDDGSIVNANTYGLGDGGTITINAKDTITLSGEDSRGLPSIIFSQVETGGQGKAGGITIDTGSLFLANGAQLGASTFGMGDAQAIVINAEDIITVEGESSQGIISGIFSNVAPGAEGNSGGITITTGSLSVTGGAQISAGTSGVGNGEVIKIKATDTIVFSGQNKPGFVSGIFNQVRGQGNSGGIIIETSSLSLDGGALVSSSTFTEGNAGDITITASDKITLEGKRILGFGSGIFSQVSRDAKGTAGDITINTGSLVMKDGTRISAITFFEGDAGKITINATDAISLEGKNSRGFSSGIVSQVLSTAKGNSRGIEIIADSISLIDGSEVSANTQGEGKAGNIIITANTLEATNGGQIQTNTTTNSNAADITLKINDNLFLSGIDSGLFAQTEGGGTSGNVNITASDIFINDNGAINVSATATGEAGSLNINAQDITLNNGRVTAETRTGDRGNITIDKADTLLLRNNSEITTNATEQATGGDITITSALIVLQNNSNITANAIEGRGGNILINTQGLFQDLDSEITAASELGIDGTISINTPDVDPASGLVELPDVPVDVSALLARNICDIGRGKTGNNSSFINTGRGGLPPNPYESLESNNIFVDVQLPTEWRKKPTTNSSVSQPATKPIVEASSWVVNEKGNVELVSQLASKNLGCGSNHINSN